MTDRSDSRAGLTRRGLLATAGAGATGVALGAAGAEFADGSASTPPRHVPFHGTHQAGIATPPQAYLALATFDITGGTGTSELRDLLHAWTRRAEHLTTSSDASLTVTFGLGPSVFSHGPLAAHRPTRLVRLPPFRGDALESRYSGGDFCVQACADDERSAFAAIHALAKDGRPVATVRWLQHGFRESSGPDGHGRNLFGFREGARNLDPRDRAALRRHVWAARDDARWFHGGTYLVVRRIRMLLDEWDDLPLSDQEETFGRTKRTDHRLSKKLTELPPDAHIRLAAPETNGGIRILRRSYSYSDGIDTATRQLDAGLVFVAFQADPGQFVAIQRRLSYADALRRHIVHTGSAVFACLPGAHRGSYLGESLFKATA